MVGITKLSTHIAVAVRLPLPPWHTYTGVVDGGVGGSFTVSVPLGCDTQSGDDVSLAVTVWLPVAIPLIVVDEV
jgi:hypothetical protein